MNTTAAQNEAHRTDLTWIKIGTSEYMRSDGMTIKRNCMTYRWEVRTADGEIARNKYGFTVTEHSLTWAKFAVQAMDEGAC